MVTDPASAETIKYATNAFLATKISFVNAVAAVCEAVGADVNDVVLGMGYDKRIGHEFLRPGPGWGGSLLPEGHPRPGAHRRGRRLRLRPAQGRDRRSTRSSSSGWPTRSSDMAGGSVDGMTIAVWGLTLQGPHRRPAATRRRSRSSAGSSPRAPSVQAYDPAVDRDGPTTLAGIERRAPTRTPRATAPSVLAVLTEWDEFKWLDLDKVADADGRRHASSTPATCSTAPACCAAASRTRASGGS